MRKPATALHRRPPAVARRAARTRAEAAVDLVRVEFDAARLEREIAQLDRRSTLARQALEDGRRRARALVTRLSDEGERR
jgi:hypothetical protein